MDAMVDLTGGLAERYDMEDTENLKKLYTHLLKSSRNGAFITCSRKVGLIKGGPRRVLVSCGIFLFSLFFFIFIFFSFLFFLCFCLLTIFMDLIFLSYMRMSVSLDHVYLYHSYLYIF